MLLALKNKMELKAHSIRLEVILQRIYEGQLRDTLLQRYQLCFTLAAEICSAPATTSRNCASQEIRSYIPSDRLQSSHQQPI